MGIRNVSEIIRSDEPRHPAQYPNLGAPIESFASIGSNSDAEPISEIGCSDSDGGEAKVRNAAPVVMLPASWAKMNATKKNAWISGNPALQGINWKKRTGMFHAWARVEAIGVSITAAGVRTLTEAIAVRDHLRAMADGYRP